MIILLDAMGGDNAPDANIKGAVNAINQIKAEVLLIGNKIVVDIALAIIALLAMSEYFNAVEKVSKPVRWLGYVSCFSIAFIHIIPVESLNMVVTLAVPKY